MSASKFARLFVLIAVFFAASAHAQNQLVPAEFEQRIRTDKAVQLVDVRTEEEFGKGHIEGAVNFNINNSEFSSLIRSLDKSRPVYVYCLAGPRSTRGAELMRKQGFQVFELRGGMMAWNREKKPVVTLEAKSAGMSHGEYTAAISKDELVLVDFYAKWCGPCKKMAPDLEELKQKYEGKMVLMKVDADANGSLLDQLNVQALPTLILYKDGKQVWNHTGYLDKRKIESQLQKNL